MQGLFATGLRLTDIDLRLQILACVRQFVSGVRRAAYPQSIRELPTAAVPPRRVSLVLLRLVVGSRRVRE
jgi:hypothetical protein